MVDTAILAEPTTTEPIILSDRIWHTVEKLSTQTHFSPAIDSGFQRYRIINLSQPGTDNRQWLSFPTANEMVDCYYQTFQASEISRNLKERLLIQIDSTLAKLKERVSSYKKIIDSGAQIEHDKLCADLILANLNLANSRLAEGQTEFICEYNLNNFSQAELITIPLDVNLSASENAQKYYQRYAREKRRRVAAQINYDQLMLKVSQMEEKQQLIGHSKTLNQLQSIKDEILPPDAKDLSRKKIPAGKSKRRSSIISATSGDGWTIYMGRNRLENDRLLTVIAKPNDIWLHVLGQSGSHVLIKVPSTKLDPPMTTLIEAAQLAAHFSKARSAVKSKVRVVYTHCRFVKKIAGGKPGVVNYEKEKTIEVDVDSSLPSLITQLNR
jgi:predicted ribosome quality control (RQC) complex YloA/Tae2 family protein